jgi:hypothetical protein
MRRRTMTGRTRKKSEFTTAEVRCWQGVAGEAPDGTSFAFRRGDSVKASHPAVQHIGSAAFVASDVPEGQWPSPDLVLAPPPEDDHQTKILGPIPSEHRLRALRSMTYAVPNHGVLMLRPGDVVDGRDPMIKKIIESESSGAFEEAPLTGNEPNGGDPAGYATVSQFDVHFSEAARGDQEGFASDWSR